MASGTECERGATRFARVATGPWVRLALGAVLVALAVAVGMRWERRRRPPARRPAAAYPSLPQAHPIWDSWRTAWAGDAAAHLACFAAPRRTHLEAERAAKGREAFARELKAEADKALGIELGPPEHVGDALVFPVTVQHEHDAERLDYRVVRDGAEWKISEVVSRGRVAAAPPYAERLGPPASQGD